jgi:selenocysteine lyase/cysteine desulfurase
VTAAPERPQALFEHLQAHDVTGALRNRKLRLSPTYYNDETDLQVVLDALDAFSPDAAPS